MEKDVNQRIRQVQKHYDLNEKNFIQKIGVAQSTYNSLFSRGSKPSVQLIESIANAFPQIDTRWLITGKGEMLCDDMSANVIVEQPYQVPILPYYARGGAMDEFVVSVTPEQCDKMISPIRDAQLAVPIVGDSMHPTYPNGAIVLVRKIDDGSFVEWGKAYVLDTCNGAVCKVLTQGSTQDSIKCISINKDEMYAPFEINKKDIYGIYRILMRLIKE